MSIVLTILGISLLIVLHELGHYLVARAFDMRVLKFSVGFGPALWKTTRGETQWQFAAIPLGGFVQIYGLGPSEDEQETPEQAARSFKNKPVWQRLLVIFAGPAMNWLLAAFFIFLLAWTVGFSQPDPNVAVLGEIFDDQPAQAAGLMEGDRVLSVGDAEVSDWNTFVEAVRAHPDQTVRFQVVREGETLEIDVTPKMAPQGEIGIIGVGPSTITERFGFFGSIGAGVQGAWSYTVRQTTLIWGLFRGSEKGRLGGIPEIVRMVSAQAEKGLRKLLQALAWLSIGLFILNLLPIPALDGSRLVFLSYEAIRRKPVNETVENVVHAVGFIFLLGLMIFVSIRDLL